MTSTTSVMEAERDKYRTINFEETELRLGLPLSGGSNDQSGDHHHIKNSFATTGGKRVFSDTTTTNSVDLKLNLSSSSSNTDHHHDKAANKENNTASSSTSTASPPARANDPAKPPAAKAQVVGWPPVRSFRKNIVSAQRSNNNDGAAQKATATTAAATTTTAAAASNGTAAAAFVKVSMDGAPYLRKVDLKLYKSYQQLSEALADMFSSFTVVGSHGTMKDFINESNLIDLLNGSDYVPTYEDRDGDWMLVGDVPWEMFVESCKRLRIMKGSEAIGLAPRAVEKCKNRS